MSLLFPRIAYAPVRCAAPSFRHEFAPLFSLFDDASKPFQQFERITRQRPFNPRFDVKEEKEAYVLEGEVPGFSDSDLSIEWNNNVLAISGKHHSVTEAGKKPETVAETAEPATTSETASVESQKSYKATVEDEEPVHASDVAAESSTDAAAPQPAAIQASATTEEKKPEVQRWISERRSGHFLRQFAFPSNAVDHEAIKASLQSGILKIVVPKAPTPESRHINIE